MSRRNSEKLIMIDETARLDGIENDCDKGTVKEM